MSVESDPIHAELVEHTEHTRQSRKLELEFAGASVSEVLKCLPEATLYRNGVGRACTGWRWLLATGQIQVLYESGWRAEPSEWTTPRVEARLITADDIAA